MITCPSCGEENPERAKFCLNCATPLGVENEARPELKFATALFADLVGSTTLAEICWGLDNYVWNNDGDTAKLRRRSDVLVDSCSYSGAGFSVPC